MGFSDTLAEIKKLSQNRKILVTLSFSKIITLLIFFLFAIIWFFIMGLLIGRGYEPEKNIPKIAGIMPQKEDNGKKPHILGKPSSYGNGDDSKTSVIDQLDLAYRTALKGKSQIDSHKVQSVPVKKQENKNLQRQNSQETKNKTEVQKKPKEKATPQKTSKEKVLSQKEKPTRQQNVFDYIYQVAASKDKSASQKMVKKLNNAGFKASLSGPIDSWYRVSVSVRGKPEEMDSFKKSLKKSNISKVILRSKKPIKNK